MFTHKHYVPILKAKEGEFKALQDTKPETKENITPLFEIVGIPWDYANECEQKTIDEHLEKIGKKILDAWGVDSPTFLDSNLIEGDVFVANGNHHLVHLFEDFDNKNLKVIPVTGISRSQPYKEAVKLIISKDKRGACFRLTNEDIANPNLNSNIKNALEFYNLNTSSVDIVIDLEALPDDLGLLPLTMSTFINSELPYLEEWRTLTICSTSFPVDLGKISANTIDFIPRLDWELWNLIIKRAPKRLPSYGDYSISNPTQVELDPRIITVSASIRYTHDDAWLIVRGRGTKIHGWSQYHNLCANLILRPEYCGSNYSWGDFFINECASGTTGPGNATTWRKVGNNHHFQKVITQISNLP